MMVGGLADVMGDEHHAVAVTEALHNGNLSVCDTPTIHRMTPITNSNYHRQVRLWRRTTLEKSMRVVGKRPRRNALPRHNPGATTTSSQQQTSVQPPKLLHLLMCMHSAKFEKSRLQSCIDGVDTDYKLFAFLRSSYTDYV